MCDEDEDEDEEDVPPIASEDVLRCESILQDFQRTEMLVITKEDGIWITALLARTPVTRASTYGWHQVSKLVAGYMVWATVRGMRHGAGPTITGWARGAGHDTAALLSLAPHSTSFLSGVAAATGASPAILSNLPSAEPSDYYPATHLAILSSRPPCHPPCNPAIEIELPQEA